MSKPYLKVPNFLIDHTDSVEAEKQMCERRQLVHNVRDLKQPIMHSNLETTIPSETFFCT